MVSNDRPQANALSRRSVIAAGCGLFAGTVCSKSTLEAQTIYHTPEFVDLGDITLRYKSEGEGRGMVVLLHEMGMSLEGWDYVAAELSKSFHILRYDLRGFGLSEKIVGEVRWDEHLQDLAQLLSRLGPRKPTYLVGAALGGAIALKFAAAYPDHVQAMAALAPALGGTPASRPGSMKAAMDLVKKGARAWVSERLGDADFATLRTNAERFSKFKALQFANDTTSWAATMRMVAETDFDDVYAKVGCPVLMVGAEAYQGRPVSTIKTAADRIRLGTYMSLPTGHFMAIQAPELVTPLVRDFFNKHA